MSGFLNTDEISKLFDRASEGNLPMEPERRDGRVRWLRTVDFTRPTKFSPDQERRLRRATESFAERVGRRLIALHRIDAKFEVIDVQQLIWEKAVGSIPAGSAYVTVETRPHGDLLLLGAELPVVLAAVDRLVGGKGDGGPTPERAITPIDRLLFERVSVTMVDALSEVWFDISGMSLAIAAVDTDAETVQVAAGTEPTLAITMEVQIDGLVSTLTLLVPYAAIAPVADSFSRRLDIATAEDPSMAAALQASLTRVTLTMRAEAGETELSLADVLALEPGDVVVLDAKADDPVRLFVDRAALYLAKAGCRDDRRAVQVLEPIVEDDDE